MKLTKLIRKYGKKEFQIHSIELRYDYSLNYAIRDKVTIFNFVDGGFMRCFIYLTEDNGGRSNHIGKDDYEEFKNAINANSDFDFSEMESFIEKQLMRERLEQDLSVSTKKEKKVKI